MASAAAAASAAATAGVLSTAEASESADLNTQPYLTANFIADAASKAGPALVNISSGHSSGSGFIIDSSGLVLTNMHVVRDAMRYSSPVRVTLSLSGVELQGVVQHADANSDIAVIRVRSSKPL